MSKRGHDLENTWQEYAVKKLDDTEFRDRFSNDKVSNAVDRYSCDFMTATRSAVCTSSRWPQDSPTGVCKHTSMHASMYKTRALCCP